MAWIDGAVDQQGIALVNADAGHRVTSNSKQESCLFITDQVFIEIDTLLAVISRRRRKARMNTSDKARQGNGNGVDGNGLHVSVDTVFLYSIS